MKCDKKFSNNFLIVLITFLLIQFSCSHSDKSDFDPYLKYQANFENRILKSNDFPKGTISFDSKLEYIGSESFILYKVARCEIHLFAELDSLGSYHRIYWIQYEGYLPSNLLSFPLNLKPGGMKYDYSKDPYRDQINGKEFYIKTGNFDIQFSDEDLKASPDPDDSDFDRVARILHRKGIKLNGDVLSVRMVHLDPTNKKELMIIYYESLNNDSEIAEMLQDEGKDSPHWNEVSDQLRKRAIGGMEVSFE